MAFQFPPPSSMDNSNFFVSRDEPYDVDHIPNLFLNSSNPTLDVISDVGPPELHQQPYNNGPTPLTLQSQQQSNGPFMHPMIQEFQYVHRNFPSHIGSHDFEAGPSQSRGVQSTQVNEISGLHIHNNDVMPPAFWPHTPVPFLCTYCPVFREIIHTNGYDFQKLEIHGRIGIISHAIHHRNIPNGASTSSNLPQYQMIDFSRKSIKQVKNYLVQYFVNCNAAAYVMLQDSLCDFYDALCTGFDWAADDLIDEDFDDQEEQEVVEQVAESESRPSLTIQRQRAAKMELSDLKNYLHIPIAKAAKKLGISASVLKKVGRKGGLPRWPARKVNKIMNQISELRATRPRNDKRTEEEIHDLEAYLTDYCAGHRPTVLDPAPQ